MNRIIALLLLCVPLKYIAQDPILTCGEQCEHTDTRFEEWLQLHRSGSRGADVFDKYIPVAFHGYSEEFTPEMAEASLEVLQADFDQHGIFFCRHQSNFYNNWSELDQSDLYSTASEAVALAGTSPYNVMNIHVFQEVGNDISGFSWVNLDPENDFDGVYISTDKATSNVIVHEVGHYCGLYHTFRNSNCFTEENDCELDGDRVCDTPVTNPNYSCETPVCPDADFTNHMDYTPDDCRDHFTQGQVERMHSMLTWGNRSSVWQSGECSNPNVFDVQVLSISNYYACERDYTPMVKLANYSNYDAVGADLTVYLNGQEWGSVVDIPSQSIVEVIGNEPLTCDFLIPYAGEVSVITPGDANPNNNTTAFTHTPEPLAVLNIDIQHDIFPESEQWKLFKNGVYALGGNWNELDTYDSWPVGWSGGSIYVDDAEGILTTQPYFTHDEICLTGGCYYGFYRHSGYALTQYFTTGSEYEDLECGVKIYIERGLETDTLYNYMVSAHDDDGGLSFINEDNAEVYLDFCVDDMYPDLIEPEEQPNPCPGDFDLDGDRDIIDFINLCSELGSSGECTCDMDGDQDVDSHDFMQFLAVYGEGCFGEQLAPPTVYQFERIAQRDNLDVQYYDLSGKTVTPNASGVYLAEVQINGIKQIIKVVK